MTDNERQFEDLIRDIEFDDVPDPTHRDKLEQSLLRTLSKQSPRQIEVWRTIMKAKITKLAAAAVIIMGVTFGLVTLVEQGATPAYAVEQTIEAMKNTRTVHMLCRDWEGNNIEAWMRLNPETRLPDYMYLDYPLHGAQILSTPEGSYQYIKKAGIFQVSQVPIMQFDARLENIIEDLAAKIADELKGNDNISIYKENDPNTGEDSLVIMAETDSDAIKVLIDPETKLPTSIHIIRTSNLGNAVKDFDEIYFDEDPPAALFDFIIPEGVTVVNTDEVDRLEDDPDSGIEVGNLSKQEAAELLAKTYWNAIINDDFAEAKKVRPALNLKQAKEVNERYQGSRAVELIEIGVLADQYGCMVGQVLPCVVRHRDGAIKQYKLIIKLRQINGQNSAIIAGFYGMPQEIQ